MECVGMQISPGKGHSYSCPSEVVRMQPDVYGGFNVAKTHSFEPRIIGVTAVDKILLKLNQGTEAWVISFRENNQNDYRHCSLIISSP